ncbi:MAG: hydrogenase 4 subunit F [Candidatus Methanoplasma sp.]|jgi:hydrogenase-4 component F|nr:hydrogenase 4 subunit F [Candidatus Methanoplasma sp.]
MTLGVELLIIIPVAAALLSLAMPSGKTAAVVSVACSAAVILVSLPICIKALGGEATEYGLWYVDRLSAVFILVIGVVGLMSAMYSYGYLSRDVEEKEISSKDERQYHMMFNLFVAAMLSVCIVSSMGILWITIEITTLVSAFLVGFYRRNSALEATWKYLMICSVGITLGLVGITLMYASSSHVLGDDPGALNWPVLYEAAAGLDPTLIKMAFVFVIIGFGTKMGLVPMHTWLPDAHSQSPTPVSAMLSAALLNCALYAILRFQMIADVAVPGFASMLMIGFGMLSLAAAAAFILISKDIKRMLAYSSIEHMGIIAIGFGIGTPLAVFGALFHIIAHSMTKPLVFFSAGNVIQGYGTRDMDEVRGLRKTMPFTAFMLGAGTLAIVGLPPFSVFVGEITILSGAVSAGMYHVAALTVVFIVLVFAGFTRNIFKMMPGDVATGAKVPRGLSRSLPMALLLVITLLLGLFMPEGVSNALWSIADWFSGAV